jgi:hypothetical protein
MLSVIYPECHHAECHYAECHLYFLVVVCLFVWKNESNYQLKKSFFYPNFYIFSDCFLDILSRCHNSFYLCLSKLACFSVEKVRLIYIPDFPVWLCNLTNHYIDTRLLNHKSDWVSSLTEWVKPIVFWIVNLFVVWLFGEAVTRISGYSYKRLLV